MPLHPFIVHFPIVLLIIGVISLWISFWKVEFFERLANYALIGGWLGLVAAVLSGNASVEFALQQFNPAASLIDNHQRLGTLTMIVFLLTLIVQGVRRKHKSEIWKALVFVLSLGGLILLIIVGKFGGEIVYG